MAETNENNNFGDKLSLSAILNKYGKIDEIYTSYEIEEIISKLHAASNRAKKREEKELERKTREENTRREQEESARMQAHICEVTSMELPLDYENVYDADPKTDGIHIDNISDALVFCLTELGKVDIEYIAKITNSNCKTVIWALKGSIYQNPETWGECFYAGWESAEEYLSGSLIKKLRAAESANSIYNGYFDANVTALKALMPPQISGDNIYITLGTPWIPTNIIDDFIEYLFGSAKKYPKYRNQTLGNCKTHHDLMTGTWYIPQKSRYTHSLSVRKTYGTERIEALQIIENTLNMKSISVTDEIIDPTDASRKKRVVNEAETLAAIEKQKKLICKFKEWVWDDPKRSNELKKIYEYEFCNVKARRFDGSFLNFPGLSENITLYPYQKNAVARILFSPNTLLAHDVGAGKTYIMIAAGHELRRMGLSSKNMYVVPNNIVGQWKDIFLKMYPDSKLLCIEPRSFTPSKRQSILADIRDNDYDGIIIAYSCFESIPLSLKYHIDNLNEQKQAIAGLVRQYGQNMPCLRRKHSQLENKLDKAFKTIYLENCGVFFDELGITRLFIDEAHNFKNVPIDTKITAVRGINRNGSQRCEDMLSKVHLIQKQNGGGGVIMATGTPITNSVTDVFILQRYLQSGELELIGLQSFDSWIGMFAEVTPEFEIDVDTNSYRLVNRFSKFHNLPELSSLLSSFADFHCTGQNTALPEFDGYNDSLIAKTDDLRIFLNNISDRADSVRKRLVSKKDDNMLKITTDGRKAALDLRLVNPNLTFDCCSKVAKCAENVASIYYKYADVHATQVIFCDISTPQSKFNIYDELKLLLIGQGIPSQEIAFVHDANDERTRSKLFEAVRRGDIRIIIGSTFKLGIGVNIQERLIALHHIDIPWRPADMTQREGRILRQGNTNKKVYIYRYITEGSFDAYSWQLLETKQRFINELLSGSLTERSASDIENTVLNYAEVKALAIGNPIVKRRIEVYNELSRQIILKRKYTESKLKLECELVDLDSRICESTRLIENCKKDIAALAEYNTVSKSEKLAKREAQNRNKIRTLIGANLKEYTHMHREKIIADYRSFKLAIPSYSIEQQPYLLLINNGRYRVELGETERGYLPRIDHFINSLDFHLSKLESEWTSFDLKRREIFDELSKNENFDETIANLKSKLNELDKAIGV